MLLDSLSVLPLGMAEIHRLMVLMLSCVQEVSKLSGVSPKCVLLNNFWPRSSPPPGLFNQPPALKTCLDELEKLCPPLRPELPRADEPVHLIIHGWVLFEAANRESH